MLNDTRPGVDEQYQTANNTSDLSVEEHRRGAADILIAAGWSDSRIGAALMRLQSEYDGGEAVQRRKHDQTDAILLRGRLKTLPAVLLQIEGRADRWGMQDGKAKALAVVLWWLDRACQRCTGRLFEAIPGSPGLSAIRCRACGGHGEARLPHGQDGRRLANMLDDCTARAKLSIKNRLHARKG